MTSEQKTLPHTWLKLKALVVVLLMLSFYGCSTPAQSPPSSPKIDLSVLQPCPDSLPELIAKPGEDVRGAILDNREQSKRVYAECAAKARSALCSVGVDVKNNCKG